MKTMTIRDVRQKWPEAERALEQEQEIIITRDGKPVARLLPVTDRSAGGARFDPVENRKRRERNWEGGAPFNSTASVMESREERQ